MNKQKEIDQINKHIQELVYEKVQLKKAYNYYHCVRDADQFRHIEDNYGIGVPTSIGFTPLVKKHIDVLVGEYLELDPELQISCKDEETISNIMRDKQLKIDFEVHKLLKSQLQNMLISVFLKNEKVNVDPYIEQQIQKIKEDLEESFVSNYELAAQNILNYIKNSRDLDMKNKMRELFTDLLITGICYYRVRPSGSKQNLSYEVLNPLDTFVEKNRNEFYLNKSPRAVIRKWMTVEQVLAEYRDELSSDAISALKQQVQTSVDNANTVYVRAYSNVNVGNNTTKCMPTHGILGGLEAAPVEPWTNSNKHYYNDKILEVYEVEWLVWDREHKRLTRHEGVKIGSDVYITRGESKYITRSQSSPEECTLSINGMFFLDKNGNPFSIVLATADLQDKFDLLHFYRDNLIATSGTVGDWIDVAHMPTFLGATFGEQFEQWLAYKKNGIALFDSSQEGTQLNTTFQGFDDTIKAQAIQAIQLAIDSVEQQVASITGVFPEKLGGIQERDAVSNVKVGLKYSTLLTKQYFYAMDLMYKESNYDLLNLAKIVYKNGVSGTIILGHKQSKVFTALSEHYTLTDYDLHIQDSTETIQTRETLKGLNVELIKAGQIDPEMVVNITMSKNLTELKRYIEKAMKTKRAETDQLGQMQQQLDQLLTAKQQLEEQLQQVTKENQSLNSQLQKNNADKLELDKRRVMIEEQEMRDKKDYNDKQIEVKNKQLQVEYAQTFDNNPYNDEIKG